MASPLLSALLSPISSYARWLHTRWPAGTVERLPEVGPDGETSVPGVRIVGDLGGIPLLKFSADTGARAVQAILREPEFAGVGKDGQAGGEGNGDSLFDLVIIGGGVSGMSAALEAKKSGMHFRIYEAAEAFSTIVNFPKQKPIYTYPTDMKPAGQMKFKADVKEALLAELQAQRDKAGIEVRSARIDRVERRGDEIHIVHTTAADTLAGGPIVTRARRVIIAIGRSGNYRKMGIPGEGLDKVYNRLYDPKEFAGKNALVVGGGDSALETAIALGIAGAHVTLSYRKPEFARPKPENIDKIRALERDPKANVQVEKPQSERVNSAMTRGMRDKNQAPGSVSLALPSEVVKIEPGSVTIREKGKERALENDVVFAMIGREAPLDFFRRSHLPIRNEWTLARVAACLAFVLFCVLLYHWKSGHAEAISFGGKSIKGIAEQRHWFPLNLPALLEGAGEQIGAYAKDEHNLLFTIKRGLGNTSFYYTLAYCTCVVVFGLKRIRRKPTPYIKRQTYTLMAVQCIPLFILPEIILPWMGRNGWFESGQPLRWIADQLFESYDGAVGHERAYWRAYGFILAWPLNVYNVFTEHPHWLWLGISFVQTFVIIPLIIYRWGKGAYCGWICSCGALAETLGDAHRQKMPHGPFWNRVNMLGQAVLVFAFALLGLRIAGWALGDESWAARWHKEWFEGIPYLNYGWFVDIFLGGILGVGLYFWFSGRVWCRFACPLAALMHIYARFTKFRIFADKKKCISCNVCTSVCHQGIDVMNFANKGQPMADPECVRCSACVTNCPTGVLTFGRYAGRNGEKRVVFDGLPASPVQMAEKAATH